MLGENEAGDSGINTRKNIKGKTKRKIKNLVVNVETRKRKELTYLTKVENSREKKNMEK